MVSTCATASRTTRACSASTSPRARAAAVAWWVSRSLASRIRRCASVWVCRVRCATQFAVEVAPCSGPTCSRSAWASTAASTAATVAVSRDSSRTSRRSSPGPTPYSGTSNASRSAAPGPLHHTGQRMPGERLRSGGHDTDPGTDHRQFCGLESHDSNKQSNRD